MTILLLPLLGGCFRAPPDEGEPFTKEERAPACPEDDVASVQLHVTASTGGPIGEAVGYYVPSDEDWTTPGLCDPGLDGVYWCGWERSGDLDVWVHAPGWTTWEETITVRHDGCHPITENRQILLYPS